MIPRLKPRQNSSSGSLSKSSSSSTDTGGITLESLRSSLSNLDNRIVGISGKLGGILAQASSSLAQIQAIQEEVEGTYGSLVVDLASLAASIEALEDIVGDLNFDEDYLRLDGTNEMGGTLKFEDGAGDKIYFHTDTYGIGLEADTLTQWAANRFRWRQGGNDVSSGSEVAFLNNLSFTTQTQIQALGDIISLTRVTAPVYTVADTRALNPLPSALPTGYSHDFKDRATIGGPGSGTYGSTFTIKQWGDASGGRATQIFYGEDNTYIRKSSADHSSWDSWNVFHVNQMLDDAVFGASVLPSTDWTLGGQHDLGKHDQAWRSAYIGELRAEVFTVEEQATTIQGFLRTGSGNVLAEEALSTDTTLLFLYNNFSSGEWVWLSSYRPGSLDPPVHELIKINGAPSSTTNSQGEDCFSYAVLRGQSPTTARDLFPGDGAFSTGGSAGYGFIEQYAQNSLLTGTSINGPAIDFYERTGTGAFDFGIRASIGNLRGHYGISTNTYGAGFGNFSEGHVLFTEDEVSFRNSGTVLAQIDEDGFYFGDRMSWDGTTFTFAGFEATDSLFWSGTVGTEGNFTSTGFTLGSDGWLSGPSFWFHRNGNMSLGGGNIVHDATTDTTTFTGIVNVTGGSAATSSYVQSRGLNLVTNGTGLLGDITNFPGWTFDTERRTAGSGSFRTDTDGSRFSTELIPVFPEQTYQLSFDAISDPYVGGIHYSGVISYDMDQNSIAPYHYMRFTGSTYTTLANDLDPGDPTIVLTDATGWCNSGANAYQKLIRFHVGVSNGGYEYGEEYSRLVHGSLSTGEWASGGITGNTITLLANWTGPSYPAGTPVANVTSGGSYQYFPLVGTVVPNTWTSYKGVISGVHTNYEVYASSSFPPATAFVKLMFLPNYGAGSVGGALNVGNISFKNQTEISDLGGTIISGGTIITDLLDVDEIFAEDISASGTISTSQGTPGYGLSGGFQGLEGGVYKHSMVNSGASSYFKWDGVDMEIRTPVLGLNKTGISTLGGTNTLTSPIRWNVGWAEIGKWRATDGYLFSGLNTAGPADVATDITTEEGGRGIIFQSSDNSLQVWKAIGSSDDPVERLRINPDGLFLKDKVQDPLSSYSNVVQSSLNFKVDFITGGYGSINYKIGIDDMSLIFASGGDTWSNNDFLFRNNATDILLVSGDGIVASSSITAPTINATGSVKSTGAFKTMDGGTEKVGISASMTLAEGDVLVFQNGILVSYTPV